MSGDDPTPAANGRPGAPRPDRQSDRKKAQHRECLVRLEQRGAAAQEMHRLIWEQLPRKSRHGSKADECVLVQREHAEIDSAAGTDNDEEQEAGRGEYPDAV